MNKMLCNILRDKLIGLPFIDLIAGMVQTLTTNNLDKNNEVKITTRRPVSYAVLAEDCQGKIVSLLPDSKRKSIIYFEDFGVSTIPSKRQLPGFASNVRLIAWINREKLTGDKFKEVSHIIIPRIIHRLTKIKYENISVFTELLTSVRLIPPQDASLFSRYTYDETTRQMLMPPFEVFAIDLTCRYYVSGKCAETINWNPENVCL